MYTGFDGGPVGKCVQISFTVQHTQLLTFECAILVRISFSNASYQKYFYALGILGHAF